MNNDGMITLANGHRVSRIGFRPYTYKMFDTALTTHFTADELTYGFNLRKGEELVLQRIELFFDDPPEGDFWLSQLLVRIVISEKEEVRASASQCLHARGGFPLDNIHVGPAERLDVFLTRLPHPARRCLLLHTLRRGPFS